MDNITEKQNLTQKQLVILDSEMAKNGKSMVIAYLLWFFLGVFGAHRFYNGNTGYAILMLLFSWMTCGIWWVIDGFLLHGAVTKQNQALERNLIDKIQKQAFERY